MQRVAPVLIVLAVAAVTGCGSSLQRTENSHQVAHPVPLGHRVLISATAIRKRECETRTTTLGSPRFAYAALVPRRAVARARPGTGAVVQRIEHLDVNGLPTVLGVVGATTGARCVARWYRVQLSIAPNGRTAWVAARTVRVYRLTTRIVISLSRRELAVYRFGRRVLRAPIAVGAAATPTPTGRFFVNERYVLDDPNGPFGAAALGLSAHSTVLHEWAEGGPVALHGTNEPWLLSRAVSHGCVRLRNADIERVLRLSPAGTPVLIRA
jgi:lipoprotein-anchoring transpeptidase ErfK/SrfK